MRRGSCTPWFGVGVLEAEALDERAAVGVSRRVQRGDGFEVKRVEGVGEDGAGGLFAVAAAPEGAGDVDSHFADARLIVPGAKAGDARVLAGGPVEDGPVLDAEFLMANHFQREALLDLLIREGAAEVAGDFRVLPESGGEGEVGGGPVAETEAGGGEEVVHVRRAFCGGWRRAGGSR